MKEYNRTGKIGESAEVAGVDRKTASKYIRGGGMGPGEAREQRNWRTHPDDFAEVWPMIEEELRREPQLMAKTLWKWLLKERAGKFAESQRRTFERRVSTWKRRHGAKSEIFFRQEHRPGERLQLDWTEASQLEVQIGGCRLAHKLVVVALPYSNWQWARVCRSESFLSLKMGLQSAVWELGGVTGVCQTDNSSTVTHRLSKKQGGQGRGYNERYLGFLASMGMKPGLIGIGKPNQNGDVESGHGHLLRAIEDELRLRGSREFESLNAYEGWLFELMRERNAVRQERVEKEKAMLGALPARRWPEYEEQEVCVNRESIVRVGKMGYSVPSRWVGRRLRARIGESTIVFYDGSQAVVEVERGSGDSGMYVNWRHVIGAIQRKPGAMARWRHRDCLFPSYSWRRVYDEMLSRYTEGRAEREYLGVLGLALENGLEAVEAQIERMGADRVDLDEMRRAFGAQSQIIEIAFEADLSAYDALLNQSKVQGEGLSHV